MGPAQSSCISAGGSPVVVALKTGTAKGDVMTPGITSATRNSHLGGCLLFPPTPSAPMV